MTASRTGEFASLKAKYGSRWSPPGESPRAPLPRCDRPGRHTGALAFPHYPRSPHYGESPLPFDTRLNDHPVTARAGRVRRRLVRTIETGSSRPRPRLGESREKPGCLAELLLSMNRSNAAHDRKWADALRERRHNRSTGVARAARLEATVRGKALSAMEARARSQNQPGRACSAPLAAQ